jgi:hypothetical protein
LLLEAVAVSAVKVAFGGTVIYRYRTEIFVFVVSQAVGKGLLFAV